MIVENGGEKGGIAVKAELSAPKVTITNTEDGVELTWKKISDSQGYRVGRTLASNTTYKFIATLKSRNKVTYTDRKAKAGQPYLYTVVAYTKSNGSYAYGKHKNYRNIYLETMKPPALESGEDGVVIYWDHVEGAGFYQVYRWEEDSDNAVLLGTVNSRYDGAIDRSAERGERYQYGVRAGVKYSGSTYYSSNRLYVTSITYGEAGDDEDDEEDEDEEEDDEEDEGNWDNDNDPEDESTSGTTYRALLIGNAKYGGDSNLVAPPYDVRLMKNTLSATNYQIKYGLNLTASEMASAIQKVFKDADSDDVSLIFYSGHGVVNEDNDTTAGALVGVDMTGLTSATLAALCKKIPGKVIVLLDSCSSGSCITNSKGGSEVSTFDAQLFNQSFCDAFAAQDEITRDKRGEMRVSNKFYVLASSKDNQTSIEAYSNSYAFGYFTAAFCSGCGYLYSSPNKWKGRLYADENNDGVITLEESFDYCYAYVKELSRNKQTVQRYPTNSSQVIYQRK